MQWHWAHSQHCMTITSIYFQNLSIAPKGNPKPISSHSLLPLPQPLAICQHIWKTQQWHRTGKGVFIPVPKKSNAKWMFKLALHLFHMLAKHESEVAQSCPTLCDPMECSLLGSSLQGILQARILEWVAISFSRGASQPRDRTQVSHIAGRCFNLWATRVARLYSKSFKLGFSSTQTKNFQMYSLGLKKAEEAEIKLPTFIGT